MLLPWLVPSMSPESSIRPIQLTCEALPNPMGIATDQPRFSWKLDAAKPGRFNLRQSAFRVIVSSTEEAANRNLGDLWDSGAVASDNTINVRYAGKPLSSGQPAWWRVQVTDQDGAVSGWSTVARWSVGLLNASDWKAQWIGFDKPYASATRPESLGSASWIAPAGASGNMAVGTADLFATVTVGAGLTSAKFQITGDDAVELQVNSKVALASNPETDSWRTVREVDVAKLLIQGSNEIHARLTNTGDAGGLIGRLVLRYADGRVETVVTDGSWFTRNGAGVKTPARVIGAYGIQPWGKVGSTARLLPAPRLLAKDFSVAKPIRRATLYGSALGLIELNLNGKRVSDDLFTPGWTDYTKRVYSSAYDVTTMLKQGTNEIGALLGDGWYSGYVGYGGNRDHYGKKTRALVQLNIEYADGSTDVVASDPSWRATTGPVLESDFLMGERYDARLENTFRNWAAVDTGAEVNPAVEPFPGQPVRRYATLRAKTVTPRGKDVYILNFGQNLAGFAQLKVRGKAGQTVKLRFAERLSPNGDIYTTNLRGARATDEYTLRGEGLETWEPKFTFHGFQYVEVSGLGHRPSADEVTAVAISSDTPTVGKIETGDQMINQLVSNAWWTQRMNFIDIPTDCPQRDERLGWTGDAQAYVRTASMLTDVHPFFTKWLVSLDDGQRADGQFPMVAPVKVAGDDGGPAWADAGVICPWTIYDVYGDQELLARHYPQMKKFVEFCRNRSTAELLPPAQFHCFGDWLNINSPTPNEVIYTAYFAGSSRIVSRAAVALGNTADAAAYEDLYQRVRAAFRKTYVSDGGKVAGDSQCAYVLALQFDLLDSAEAADAAKRLVADIEKRGWHLSTGFVGTRDIMHVLSKIGRNDVAFRLLHNTTFPSWGFTIKNGATSIWERWDGWTPEKGFQDAGMNSFAHYAFGAVVGWIMAQPAGITNTEAGFGRIKVAPQIDPTLGWLKSSYDSVRGKIVSEWRINGKQVSLKVVVPPNVRAEIHLPATDVRASGGLTGRNGVYEVGSGEYTFTGTLPANLTR